MNLPTEQHDDCDLCEQDLARQLAALEDWGQAERRDAVRALLASLPEPLAREVITEMPWVPDLVVIDKNP